MSLLQLRTPAPGTVPLETFFGHVLPTVLQDADAAQTDVGGRFGFSVRGDGGGAWTVDLAARTVEPVLKTTDVTLTLSVSACNALLQGDACPDEIAIAGDRRLLRRLADILLVFAAAEGPAAAHTKIARKGT